MLRLRKRLGKTVVEIDDDCNHSFAERVYFINLNLGAGKTRRSKTVNYEIGRGEFVSVKKSEGKTGRMWHGLKLELLVSSIAKPTSSSRSIG